MSAAKEIAIVKRSEEHSLNASEMLLASIRKCWYQTRGQIVPEVRNHRNEKTAVSAVVHPGVDRRRRSQAHVHTQPESPNPDPYRISISESFEKSLGGHGRLCTNFAKTGFREAESAVEWMVGNASLTDRGICA